MKKLFALVLVSCMGLVAVGCKDSVEVDVNKKKDADKCHSCCKDPVRCPCSIDACDKNPADYSKTHKCPCKVVNCICEHE